VENQLSPFIGKSVSPYDEQRDFPRLVTSKGCFGLTTPSA